MAKQAKKQPKKPEQLAVSKKILQTVVVVTLLVFLGWLLLANPILNQLDKQRFLEAEEFIQELYESEIRPIAEPTSVESDNSCRYTSTKLGTGTLFCTTGIKAEYLYTGAGDTLELINQLNTLGADKFRSIHDRDFQEEQDLTAKINQGGAYDIYKGFEYSDMSACSVAVKKEENANVYTVTLNCIDEARAEHFSLEN